MIRKQGVVFLMLYETYQMQADLLRPLRLAAKAAAHPLVWPLGRGRVAARLEMLSRFTLTHDRPPYDIHTVTVDGAAVPVREEIALDLPFGRLLHFAKDGAGNQPKILVVAPLSGHFSTLLKQTCETLLAGHDVYITDWVNARDVPLSAGRFGFDDYVAYLIRFMEEIGPGAHLMAVCQPCVQALAAVAVMSEDKNPATPLTLTLMAGPIDPRENPTSVNDHATTKPLRWFETRVIARVPWRYRGRGRRVYPGFMQLTAFLAMNMERHKTAHKNLYGHLAKGETEQAEKIKEFYDEYFAVLDMTEEFYVETIDRVFQRAQLATGALTYRGRKVDPAAIRKTALLTVEGGRDDICGVGQTSAAHRLCTSLRPKLRRHHFEPHAGHYGTFSGKRWQNAIYPVVREFIQAKG